MPNYGFFNNNLRQSFLDAIEKFNLKPSLDEHQEELLVIIEGEIDLFTPALQSTWMIRHRPAARQ